MAAKAVNSEKCFPKRNNRAERVLAELQLKRANVQTYHTRRVN